MARMVATLKPQPLALPLPHRPGTDLGTCPACNIPIPTRDDLYDRKGAKYPVCRRCGARVIVPA